METLNPAQTTGLTDRWVRVTGVHNGLVEFDYAFGDLAMSVELILPKPVFDEFCQIKRVVVLASDSPCGIAPCITR